MIAATKLHPRYVVDQEGHQIDVVLSIEEYNGLLEDIEDLAVAAERIGEPGIPHEKALKEF